MSANPIGIFDSGVGGLSVAREIALRLPHERLLYFADTAYCPYGGRPLTEIRERSLDVADELVRRGAKAVVVACNTATGAALEELRATFPIPIVGLEPAVKPAVARSVNRRVGVMATATTLRTERFARLIRDHAVGVEIFAQPCPGLADLVEAGETEGPLLLGVLGELLAPLKAAGVDTVVLGCTHYPFVRSAVTAVMGEGVEILDSGAAVARQVERVLRAAGVEAREGEGGMELLTSAEPRHVAEVVARLWGSSVTVQTLSQTCSSGAPSPTGSAM